MSDSLRGTTGGLAKGQQTVIDKAVGHAPREIREHVQGHVNQHHQHEHPAAAAQRADKGERLDHLREVERMHDTDKNRRDNPMPDDYKHQTQQGLDKTAKTMQSGVNKKMDSHERAYLTGKEDKHGYRHEGGIRDEVASHLRGTKHATNH